MADEVVSIKAKVEVHDRQLNRLIVKMKALEQLERRLASGRRMESMARKQSRSINEMTRGWTRMFDMVDAGVKMMGKALSGFLKLAIKGVSLEMALLSATMVATHAVFVAGQLVMKAYRGVMQLVAGGAAGLTVALAAVSSAIREQQAAIFAYRGRGAREFGSAMDQTRTGMRALQADTELATLGVDALNQAYGILSKTMNVREIMGSKSMLKALMDFGSAGQDPAKGLQQVAEVVAALNDPKKGMSAVREAAKKLGPEMEKALKMSTVKTKEDFQNLLFSGELARIGGVAGQFGAINNTLIGQLKAYMTRVRTTFADFGDQFLEPLKVAFEEVFLIIKRDIARIMSAVQLTIGYDGYIDGFVSMIDKTSNWMVKTIREYLPQAIGMFGRISDWFERFRDGWNAALDYFRPLIDGARVLYKVFAPIWDALYGGMDNLFYMKDLLLENSGAAQEFGEKIGGFISALSSLMMRLKGMFFDILPMINDVIDGITQVFKLMSNLLTGFSGTGFASALAPLLAFAVAGRALSNVKGRLMPGSTPYTMKTMEVQAGVVNITGHAGPFASGGRPVSASYDEQSDGGSVFEMKDPKVVSSGKRGGDGPASGGKSGATVNAFGQIIPGPIRTQPSLTLGQSIREGAGRATRNMQTAAEISARYADAYKTSGMQVLKRDAMLAGNAVLRPTRALLGGIGGAFSFLNTGAWNEKMGAYEEINMQRQALRQQYLKKTGRGYQRINTETGMPDGPIVNDGRTSMGRLGRAREYMRYKMDQNRITRNATKFGAGLTKFNQSAGGRFGSSLGLGLASQMAPEAMRGALALGGMVGQINPIAGLAIGGLGGAFTAQSSGAGALAGAAGGAAAGSMFGPAGMLVGAGLGTIFGAWRGAMNKSKVEIEAAKRFARETIGSLYEGIAKSARTKLSEFEKIIAAGEEIAAGTAGAFENYIPQVIAKQQFLFDTMKQMVPQITQYAPLISELKDAQAAGRFGDLGNILTSGLARGILTQDEYDVINSRITGQDTVGQMSTAIAEIGTMDFAPAKSINRGQAEALLREVYTNQGLYGVEITADAMQGMLKRPGEALMEMTGELEKGMKPLMAIQEQTSARLDMLSRMTGKTVPELELLAKELGVNLYDAAKDFNAIAREMGVGMAMSAQQMKFAMQDAYLALSKPFIQQREQKEGIAALNQAAADARVQLTRTKSTEGKNKIIDEFMIDYFPQMLAASGGDPLIAYLNDIALFGQGPTGGAFAEGGALAGQGEAFLANPAFQRYEQERDLSIPQIAAQQLSSMAFGQTGQALDVASLIPLISGMSGDKLTEFISIITDPVKFASLLAQPNKYGKEQGLSGLLSMLGVSGATIIQPDKEINTVSDIVNGLAEPMEKLGLSQDALKETIETMNGIFAAAFGVGDTRTPRGGRIGDTTSSRLGQTMDRHAAMDSQLTGKRTITSAFRTWGLGSPSSDHATGRAYDLVGQNLGQYARLVHANGGFAEFHGAAANRHLHVVPGSGVGDTATNRAMLSTSVGTGSVTNYYNFEINGGNQSPEAIAQMVMMKIKENERTTRERS